MEQDQARKDSIAKVEGKITPEMKEKLFRIL